MITLFFFYWPNGTIQLRKTFSFMNHINTPLVIFHLFIFLVFCLPVTPYGKVYESSLNAPYCSVARADREGGPCDVVLRLGLFIVPS